MLIFAPHMLCSPGGLADGKGADNFRNEKLSNERL